MIGPDGRPEGFTIMNDFSARDLQCAEMPVGLGPAKGKDFATALGPVLVSADELPGGPRHAGDRARQRRGPDRLAHRRDAFWRGTQLLEAAARNTPGLRRRRRDRLGHGRAGGCILEHDDGRWLLPGDEIELEIEGIGVLRNRIV